MYSVRFGRYLFAICISFVNSTVPIVDPEVVDFVLIIWRLPVNSQHAHFIPIVGVWKERQVRPPLLSHTLLYGCMTWAPSREHYRLLRRTHHRLLLRVIGYRRERGTYRQLSYAQALKKTGCQSVEATIRQRRLLFAGAMARQPAGRLPKRLMDGKLVGGEDPGKGRPEQNWMDCLKDDFQAFGATDGSTVDNRLTFGVDRAVWSLAAKMDDGAPWHKVLQGAEKFMASWHKEEEEASRRRATKRDSRDLEPPTHL